ncbi:MAG: peptidoglycan DD-metalloendopeptidase family protein [Acidobacteria bacterium]|nr:peptidoglycan DD-metalloendopeptidase family protein [Acidobacteriota bacterium]
MKRNYFVVVLAHPSYGRIKRIHIPHYAAHLAVCFAIFAGIVTVGFTSSYARMLGKISEFNDLRAENAALQKRLETLQEKAADADVQLASLGSLASEVSIAFGIRRSFTGGSSDDLNFASVRNPTSQYDMLKAVRLPSESDGSMLSYLSNTTPSIWPIKGRISSSFGRRIDPFLGRGAFHSGLDLSAGRGTPVIATADGTVREAGWSGGYGKAVVISHGSNGMSTLYGHLTEIFATPGQVVRRGEVIGRSGSTGRSTSAHLHYEVRYHNTPVNPYKYLQRSQSSGDDGMVLTD